jgi:hypothetical protein
MFRSRDPQEKPDQIQTGYPAVAKGALVPSFVDAILRDGRPDVDENEVFEAMAVCHAIDRSLAEGSPVRVSHYERLPQGRGHA